MDLIESAVKSFRSLRPLLPPNERHERYTPKAFTQFSKLSRLFIIFKVNYFGKCFNLFGSSDDQVLCFAGRQQLLM